jgi:hypothetical protein
MNHTVTTRSEMTKCHSDTQVCCIESDIIGTPAPETCGIRNKDGIGFKITNVVDESQFGEVKFHAF